MNTHRQTRVDWERADSNETRDEEMRVWGSKERKLPSIFWHAGVTVNDHHH